jgi:predicted nuclease of predicted toxin-antitoxin system
LKLLFDLNLSHKLPLHMADIYPDSVHVRLLGLERAADEVIWHYAQQGGYVIISQDADYAERSRLHGSPPKVVWLRCGNTTPQKVEQLLRQSQTGIEELRRDPGLHFLELF